VRVSGDYNFAFYRLMNLLGMNVPTSKTLTRATRIRYNYQRYEQNTTCTTSPNVNATTATYDIPNG